MALEQQGLVNEQELVLAPFEDQAMKQVPWFAHLTPDFEWNGYQARYKSHLVNVPLYNQWLVRQLTYSTGVPARSVLALFWGISLSTPVGPPVELVRSNVDSLASAVQTVAARGNVDAVVNATGLGAGQLKDVHDDSVYPIRGQVAVVYSERLAKYPQCTMAVLSKHSQYEYEPAVGYVIPRAKSGQVVCGGTFTEHSYATTVDQRTHDTILRNVIDRVPDLILPVSLQGQELVRAREAVRADPESWKQLAKQVISAHAGLRPARQEGPRAEVGNRVGGTPVIHAYGLGPAGYQASMGFALAVSKLVRTQVAAPNANAGSKL